MKQNNRLLLVPILMIGVGIALVAGAIVWMLANPLAGAQSTPQPAIQSTLEERIPYPDIPRISVADAKAAIDAGKAVVVDVRGDSYYQEEHIPGALDIGINELQSRIKELGQAEWIITYCT
jgi:hypothetical protein